MKDLLAPLVPYWTAIKWAARIGVVASIFLAGRSCGTQSGRDEVAALKLAHAQAAAKADKALAKATQDAREKEHEMGDRFIAVSLKHQQDLQRAKADRDALAAAVRSGAVQLRDHWTGCLSASAAAAAGAGRPDAAADDRADSANRIVQAARECDAQVRGLQAVLSAERR